MVAHTTSVTANKGKVVVIGRFVLYPPVLTDIEQKTHWNVIGDDRIINTVFMSTGPNDKTADANLMGQGWQASIETQWGQPFMVELDRQTTWLNGAVMYLDALQQDLLWFPGGLYFDVPQDSKAVYIGTLHYIRNEFNTIKHVEIINEYEQTLNALSLQPNDVTVSLLTYPENEPKPYIAQTAPSSKIITLSAYGNL
jgi:hypothetical protein